MRRELIRSRDPVPACAGFLDSPAAHRLASGDANCDAARDQIALEQGRQCGRPSATLPQLGYPSAPTQKKLRFAREAFERL